MGNESRICEKGPAFQEFEKRGNAAHSKRWREVGTCARFREAPGVRRIPALSGRAARMVAKSLLLIFLASLSASVYADRVDEYVQQQMSSHRIPGVALMVLRDEKPIKTGSYGMADLENQVPVSADTVFEIGSISKQFTSAGILLLQQDGKLSVEDKISKHFKQIPDAWTNVTIRHLLSHTSGIKSYTGLDGFELTRHLTQQQFIETLAKQPMDFQPGERFKYCNSGFSLLGYIIENVSGTNYWSFMSQRIFKPLGMQVTGDRKPSRIILHRAHGYEQRNREWINRDYDLTDVFSAGAIVSSLGDVAKWDAALDGDQLLNEESKRQMWTVNKLSSGKPTTYGFGWFIDKVEGHANIGHSGSTSGFSASNQRFPDDKLVVIVLTNTDEQIATTLAKKIATFFW